MEYNKWYWKKVLTDEELLEEAERALNMLEELPMDNSQDTDVESDEDDVIEQPAAEFVLETNMQNIVKDSDAETTIAETDSGITTQKESDRSWKKRELQINIPDYNFPESLASDLSTHCTTPTEYFLAVLGSAIKNITYQSNLYATQKNKNLNLKENELMAFIGLNFFMGYHSLPSYKHYWNTSVDLGVHLVQKTMTRNRFQEILSFLHVNDNTTIPINNRDKIYKIRPLVNILNDQFTHLYNGTRELAVDESMIIFKGRSSLKQYNPMKPIKRGYKLWCLADQKGFIKSFEIYQGKNEQLEDKFKNFGLGERVVLQLTEPEWGKDRIIYFDNFFTSVKLLEKLKLERTLACGTIRITRKGCPKNLTDDKKMARGDFDFRISNTDISFFKWKDNKCVHFASNFHGSQTTFVGRKEKDGTKTQIVCPVAVADYNKYMGAVDHADQLRGTYCVDRRSKKWWHRLFFGLLDIAFVNSYIIYSEAEEDTMTLLDFRRSVAQGLMNENTSTLKINNKKRISNENRQSPSVPSSKRRRYNYSVNADVRLGNRGSHWITFVKERRRCEQCASNAIQSRPHSKCVACGVFLCCNEKKLFCRVS